MSRFEHLWLTVKTFGSTKINPGDVGIPTTKLDSGTVAKVLQEVFKWGGILAVIMIIVGGVMYAVSAGDETRVRQAKATITYSVVGLVVMILAFTIVNFVLGNV